jgi:outer membrane immunogenic protein
VQPAAGPLLDATPIQTTLHLYSQQATARINYRFGEPAAVTARSPMIAKAPVLPVTNNWTGCYAGGYAGGAWSRGTADTFDPSTNTAVFGPPPFVQTPFYNAGAALSAAPAPYGYNLGASGIGGGTLGCNWQSPSSRMVWGAEVEGGFMRLSGSANDPYNVANGFNDHIDSTKVGDWYGVIAGRLGYSLGKTLLYLKGGAGITRVSGSSIDTCTTGATCSPQVLNANGSASPAFFVAGGGAEWAWTQKWSLKAEYLYLGLHDSFAVCGPGGGRQFVPNLTFCADHRLNGVHTAKLGVNYKLY